MANVDRAYRRPTDSTVTIITGAAFFDEIPRFAENHPYVTAVMTDATGATGATGGE